MPYGRIAKLDFEAPVWDKLMERQQGPYFVQDMKASTNEWNVAWALDHVHLDYKFQVSYLGGRRIRGGLVLDFLVMTVPLSTPLWVHGNYWHENKNKAEDELRQATLYYEARGELLPGIVVWGDETATQDDALATIRRKFNL